MRVCLLSTQVPFIRGGAEILQETLVLELRRRKIEAEIVTLPFRPFPAEDLAHCISFATHLNLNDSAGKKIDLLIGLKFPTYYVPHPNKVMWLLHQHREVYDLWGSQIYEKFYQGSEAGELRNKITTMDNLAFHQATSVYTISKKVSSRLKEFNHVDSLPLYPPPAFAEDFKCETFDDYLLFPSRVGPLKRQELAIRSLAKTRSAAKIVFMGAPDNLEYFLELRSLAEQLQISDRIVWRGSVSHTEKIALYANCLAVLFPPQDEDLGYVTLEAMLSSKPVVTCYDSGGPTEFIENEFNGLLTEPQPQLLAQAIDRIWASKADARKWGRNSLDVYRTKNISWDNVVEKLIYQ